MPRVTTQFEIPAEVQLGLTTGTLRRHGGVISRAPGQANAGEVVLWLRETSAQPQPGSTLGARFGAMAGPLNLVGSVASVLNLGATVAFGSATLQRLRTIQNSLHRIEDSLDRLEHKVDKLQWTVDLGFFQTLQSLSRVEALLEQQVVAELTSASKMAHLAQLLEPGSPQRMQRIENALMCAERAKNQLMGLVELEISRLTSGFSGCASGVERLQMSLQARPALERFRQCCVAVALTAKITADSGQPGEAARAAALEREKLDRVLKTFGQTVLRDKKMKWSPYDELLNHHWADYGLTPQRVGRLSQVFDPEIGSLEAIVRFLQEIPGVLRPFNESLGLDEVQSKGVMTFIDLLEGASEDLDRLHGYSVEMAAIDTLALSAQEYRELLAIEAPEGKLGELALMTIDE